MSQINIESTISNNPVLLCSNNTEESVYMQIGGAKYSDFIKNLEMIKKQSNAPSLCAQCWAFMSASHSKSHTVNHKEDRMTAAQFCSEANLKALRKKHKHIREIDNFEEIKMIFSKPLKSTQKKESKDESKKIRETQEISEKSDNIISEKKNTKEENRFDLNNGTAEE